MIVIVKINLIRAVDINVSILRLHLTKKQKETKPKREIQIAKNANNILFFIYSVWLFLSLSPELPGCTEMSKEMFKLNFSNVWISNNRKNLWVNGFRYDNRILCYSRYAYFIVARDPFNPSLCVSLGMVSRAAFTFNVNEFYIGRFTAMVELLCLCCCCCRWWY